MSDDGIARSHVLGGKRRAVDGTMRRGLEGWADAIVAEAMCAGSACRRFYKGHAGNKKVNIREM